MKKISSVLIILSMLFCTFSCGQSTEEESAQAGEIVIDTDTDSSANNTTKPDGSQNPTVNDDADKKPSQPTDNNQNNEQNTTDEKEEQTEKPGAADDDKTPMVDTGASEDKQDPEEEEDYDPYAIEPQFDTYVSNTFVPTGNHYVLTSDTEKTMTFREVFPVQQYGRLEYCFYFSNCVDSTWAGGNEAYRNMPTESYEILSASVMVTKAVECTSVSRKTAVTFDKKKTRTVEPDEMFWSDPVMFNVSEGEYLVFEWKVKYTLIPCNMINGVGYGYESENGTSFAKASKGVPMPSMIGAKRDGVKSIAFIGDSISAGEGAGAFNGYVAQISKQLGADVSVWNIALGYARANDAANSPAWVKKAKATDNVAICLGVNDINSGAYNVGARTADQILGDIKTIAEEIEAAGAKVIIIAPSVYSYNGPERVQIWKDVVSGAEKYAKEKGFEFFNFGPCICDPADSSKPGFGAHPNAEGCKRAADAFIKDYNDGKITLK